MVATPNSSPSNVLLYSIREPNVLKSSFSEFCVVAVLPGASPLIRDREGSPLELRPALFENYVDGISISANLCLGRGVKIPPFGIPSLAHRKSVPLHMISK